MNSLPGVAGGDRYRTLPESRIVDLLVLGGWAYEPDAAFARRETQHALERWRELGLGSVLTPGGTHLFDPVEVLNFMKRTELNGQDDFWRTHYVPTGRRFVTDLRKDAPGERLFKAEYRRTFHLHGIASGTRLRLRMPLPLEGPCLDHLHIKSNCDATDADLDTRPGRLEARLTAAGEPSVTATAKLSFIAREQQPPSCRDISPLSDRELYLRAKEGFIVVTDRIKALAATLATGRQPGEAIRIFWDYIHQHLIAGALHYDQVDFQAPGDWVLEHGWFDCQLGSALLAALCRAQGIPARLSCGWMLYPRAPFTHYWVEAWLEDQGWTPFDLIGWELSGAGRDLAWRDYFFGRLNPRVTTERLPREFTGAIGIPLPSDWHLLQSSVAGGMQTELLTRAGTSLYTDTVRILP